MGKDLHNHLQWLEEELFEEENDNPVDLDLEFDLDDLLDEFREEEESSDLPRNRAVDFDRMAFADEAFEESAAVRVAAKKNRKAEEAPRKGAGGLVILAILEVIAILAVLLRWALWFL